MKMKLKSIFSFFLMTVLCGCTTQSVEDARDIVETKTYAYKYEYKTEENGDIMTQYSQEKPTNTDYIEDTEVSINYLQSKTSLLKFIEMNEKFMSSNYECKITDAIATTYRDYAYELVNDEYTDGMMEVLKKRRSIGSNGYLSNPEERLVWVKVNVKYNGNVSTKMHMDTSIYVKKNDKYIGLGSPLVESRELWLLPNSDEKVANTIAFSPGEELDVWICFQIEYNKDYTYYVAGSFGYIGDPSSYTGNLVKINIHDKG